jgi:hypothetical protein
MPPPLQDAAREPLFKDWRLHEAAFLRFKTPAGGGRSTVRGGIPRVLLERLDFAWQSNARSRGCIRCARGDVPGRDGDTWAICSRDRL